MARLFLDRRVPMPAGAFDTCRAEAVPRDGVLRLRLPRIGERRGARLRIPVRGA